MSCHSLQTPLYILYTYIASISAGYLGTNHNRHTTQNTSRVARTQAMRKVGRGGGRGGHQDSHVPETLHKDFPQLEFHKTLCSIDSWRPSKIGAQMDFTDASLPCNQAFGGTIPSAFGGCQNWVFVQFLFLGLNQEPLGKYLSLPPDLFGLCFNV